MSQTAFVFDDSGCTRPCHDMADDEGCQCTSREHMIRVEEWTYINHALKIRPATIYYDMNKDGDNVMFFSFSPTDWHGQMMRFGQGLMTVTFNYKGDANHMHTAFMKKKSNVRYEGENDKGRRITMMFKYNSYWCPRCALWTQ